MTLMPNEESNEGQGLANEMLQAAGADGGPVAESQDAFVPPAVPPGKGDSGPGN